MPLTRFQVRSEYGLGAPGLYKEADREDPNSILNGVTVAGLVGILRQLGDLAEFAAEVFHDLQEQVVATTARSHKMTLRVRQIEAALPPLEKAVQAQTSHIHFAYTAGSDWHANVRTEQNHFIYTDLPQFIVDSYEECRDPPRLHLLDKFDIGGPGACLKRYSDPSFFKRVLASSESVNAEKVQRHKKGRKSKKKGSKQRNREVSHSGSMSRRSGRRRFTSQSIYEQSSAAEIFDLRSNSELGDRSTSFDSRTRSDYIECVFDGSSSMHIEKQEHNEFPASRLKMHCSDYIDSVLPEQDGVANNGLPSVSLQEQSSRSSSCVTWDEKTEIVKPEIQKCDSIVDDQQEASELHPVSSGRLENEAAFLGYANSEDILFVDENIPESLSGGNQFDEIGSEPDNYMDAINTMESESETFECQTKCEVDLASSNFKNTGMEFGAGAMHEMTAQNSDLSDNESHTTSYSSSNKEMSQNITSLVSEDGLVHAQPPEITGMMSSSNPGDLSDTDVCENDETFECQTKREVDLASSNFKNTEMECGADAMHEMTSQNSDLSDNESHTTSYSSLNKEISKNFTILVSEEGLVHAQLPEITGMMSSSNPGDLSDTDLCENDDLLNVSRVYGVESAISDTSPSIPNLQAPLGDEIVCSWSKSQELHVETSGTASVKFWTNGGLLGLEPSKPPDCSASDVPKQSSLADTKDNSCDLSTHVVMPKYHCDGYVGKLDTLDNMPEHIEREPDSVGGRFTSPDTVWPAADQLVSKMGNKVQIKDQSECSTSFNDMQNDGESRKKILRNSTVPEAKLEKLEDSHYNHGFCHALGCNLIETSDTSPRLELPITPVVKTPSNEANQENIDSSSSMFNLGHRLLVNGFRRKASLVYGDASEPDLSVKTGPVELQKPLCNEKKGQDSVSHHTSSETTPKEQLECESPEKLFSSSPPLEHMKISFHPINGFETSKLKLKFPDGRHFHENIRDVIFPSFQLLPELVTRQWDIGSESDDDTFCRSSPYMSEDLLSQHSDSNSEQWEFGETPGSKGHELYDTLHMVPSAESISSSLELEGIAHGGIYPDCEFKIPHIECSIEHFHSGPLLDLPNFDALDILRDLEESKRDSGLKDLPELKLQDPNEPIPPSSPLPPSQWDSMKSDFDVVKDKKTAISGAVNHPNDMQIPGSTTSQQPMPAPPKQPHIKEANACPLKKDQQEFNGSREDNQDTNAEEADETEDLLHQIKTKSSTLRRTTSARPTTPGPTTNVKVAAILEKANAIRQAFVGTDEGEDDENWSDG